MSHSNMFIQTRRKHARESQQENFTSPTDWVVQSLEKKNTTSNFFVGYAGWTTFKNSFFLLGRFGEERRSCDLNSGSKCRRLHFCGCSFGLKGFPHVSQKSEAKSMALRLLGGFQGSNG